MSNIGAVLSQINLSESYINKQDQVVSVPDYGIVNTKMSLKDASDMVLSDREIRYLLFLASPYRSSILVKGNNVDSRG